MRILSTILLLCSRFCPSTLLSICFLEPYFQVHCPTFVCSFFSFHFFSFHFFSFHFVFFHFLGSGLYGLGFRVWDVGCPTHPTHLHTCTQTSRRNLVVEHSFSQLHYVSQPPPYRDEEPLQEHARVASARQGSHYRGALFFSSFFCVC